MKQFRSLMEPALNIFPPYLIRDLEANGFFTAPASTKYHGAFEVRSLFEGLLKASITKVTLNRNQNPFLGIKRTKISVIVEIAWLVKLVNIGKRAIAIRTVLITVKGNLRDRRFKQTLKETTKMLARLSSRLWVQL